MTAEEVFDVASRMTGEFANRVVRDAVDGVPVQFIDAEQQVYAPLGKTCVFQLVPSCLRRYRVVRDRAAGDGGHRAGDIRPAEGLGSGEEMGPTSLGRVVQHLDNHVNDVFGIDERVDAVGCSADPAVPFADGSRVDEYKLHERGWADKCVRDLALYQVVLDVGVYTKDG